MFLGVEQKVLLSELQRERNNELINNFASDYSLRFIILQKTQENGIRFELEWVPDMLSTTNILIIKKNNFSIYKDITAFKIAEMLQVRLLIFRLSTLIFRTNQIPSTFLTNTSISWCSLCWDSTKTNLRRNRLRTKILLATSWERLMR